MTSTTKPTNKGGPAARQGFKYQDHVAVQFFLKMFTDRYSVQVECETADDIVYVSELSGQLLYEYIQVKTTENDKKWTYKEITDLDAKKKDSSLVQKSLLCDKKGGVAKFRIVSKRDVYKILEFLTLEFDQRTNDDDAIEFGAKLLKKYKTTVSVSGRTLADWAESCVWQVAGNVAHLEAQNRTTLFRLAETYGLNLTYTQSAEIYHELLDLADDAATANAITEPNKKIIKRADLENLLRSLFENAKKSSTKTSKPYFSKPDEFLVEFHKFDDIPLNKGFRGYDVQYDFDEWRGREFAQHLLDWLPEFALKPSELVGFGHHNARQLLARAHSKIINSKLEKEKIIAELILHSLLRSTLNSEPIACKVFAIENGNFSFFGNAHIVHYPPPRVDELWLGQAKLIPATQHSQILEEFAKTLEDAITKTVLSDEREIVVTLREPNHLLPVTKQLEQALAKNAKVEDLLKIVCFPLMLAYDSNVLSKGYNQDYIDHLLPEIEDVYRILASKFPQKAAKIKVTIFFIPIESVQDLTAHFDSACKGI